MKKGMVFRNVMAIVEEEWMIDRIDSKYRSVQEYGKVTTTVTSTSVIFKDGVKVLKKKKAKTA